MSFNSLLKYLSDYISHKITRKIIENSCLNMNNQSFSQILAYCNRMNISSIEYFSSFVSERMIKLLNNLYITNELCLEYLLMATILFDRVLENPTLSIDLNNFVEFFIICVALFLKFNNDYYYLTSIISNSQILKFDYSRYEAFVLEALDYKLFTSEKEYHNIINTILRLSEMANLISSQNVNENYFNSPEKEYYSKYNVSSLSNTSFSCSQDNTRYIITDKSSCKQNASYDSSMISSNLNNKSSRKKVKNNNKSLIDNHAILIQKIQSSNDEIYNNYIKNYYEAQQVQQRQQEQQEHQAPVFIIHDM
jgi:hypothetical protein